MAAWRFAEASNDLINGFLIGMAAIFITDRGSDFGGEINQCDFTACELDNGPRLLGNAELRTISSMRCLSLFAAYRFAERRNY